MRLRDERPDELPHALVLLGDQIYAHKPPFDTLEFIKERRSTEGPPGEVVADFEEYARIYHDAWIDPAIRWLLSTVPSAMVFDDHEVGDDWNISATSPPRNWIETISTRVSGMRTTPGPSCATSPTAPTAARMAPAGATIVTSATRAS